MVKVSIGSRTFYTLKTVLTSVEPLKIVTHISTFRERPDAGTFTTRGIVYVVSEGESGRGSPFSRRVYRQSWTHTVPPIRELIVYVNRLSQGNVINLYTFGLEGTLKNTFYCTSIFRYGFMNRN